MPPPITTRRPTADDLDALLVHAQAGFDSFAEFSAAGWRPPRAAADSERSLAFLADPQTWALLALADGASVGHVAFMAARDWLADEPPTRRLARPLIPGVAHLWRLFVLPDWWGRGVAALLHDAAISEMRARRYKRARLFTPSEHARARRFYERRGWTATGEEWNDGLAFMVTEYWLDLS